MKITIYAKSCEHIMNGSFYKETNNKASQYMNGDFIKFIDVDNEPYVSGLIAYDYEKVKNLIPSSIL